MAVTVDVSPHIVLDSEYRIVEVGPAAEAWFGPLCGETLWDAFPESQPLFQPHYERARGAGEPVEFVQFYDGHVWKVRAVPRGSQLLVSWEVVHRLATLTFDELRDSLEAAIAAVERQADVVSRGRARESLSVVEGGS